MEFIFRGGGCGKRVCFYVLVEKGDYKLRGAG